MRVRIGWCVMPNKNGLYIVVPTSVDKTGSGSTATIGANGSVTFSSCATISLNGIFTADYDNYLVVLKSRVAGGASYYNMRLRASGTDNSGASSYVYQQVYVTAGLTFSGTRSATNAWRLGYYSGFSTYNNGNIMYFYGPQMSERTAYRTISAFDEGSAMIMDEGGTHDQSVSYDGLSLINASAGRSLSGRITVYGLRD